jgi:hypothetical protein
MNTSSKRALAVAAILVGLMAGVALLFSRFGCGDDRWPTLTASPRVAISPSTRSPAATAPTAIPAPSVHRKSCGDAWRERIGASPPVLGPAVKA